MASTQSPIPQPSLSLTPLVAALSIIASVILTLVGLHLLLRKLRNGSSNNPVISQTGQSSPTGVKKEVLDMIPIQSYSEEFHKKFLWNDCSVCLSGLEEGDLVRVLPNCRHGFHVQCIDAWFLSHSSCPLCRSEVTEVEAWVVALEVKEEDGEGSDNGDGSGQRRSSSMLWSSDFGLMSFREKLGLKRCLSLNSCNV